MTALLDILEPRAIELTLIIVLGGIVAGLVTYIIRNLQGSFNMLSPAVQAQESRVSNLEGRIDREREELDIIFRAVDLKIDAISYRLDTNKQNRSEFNSEFKELRRGHYGLFEEVHSRFNLMQSDIHEAQANFHNVSSQLKQMKADLKQVETGLQHTDANMKQVETRLQRTESGLQVTISNIEEIGSDLENRFESLNDKVDAWSNATNQVTAESQRDIGEIRAIIQSARDRIRSDD